MRIESLRYLQTLVTEGSINAASRKLFISPQSLSRIIADMEKELNIQLFNRSRYGISPTEKCNKLIEASILFLLELDKICDNNSVSVSGEYYMMATPGFINLSPSFLSKLYRDFPNLDFNISYEPSRKLFENFYENISELALITVNYYNDEILNPFNEEQYLFYPLGSHKYCCIVGSTSILKQYKTASLTTLARYPWIIEKSIFEESSFMDIANKIVHSERIIYTDNFSLTKEMVKDDVGISFVPENAAHYADDKIFTVNILDNIKTSFGYLIKKNYSLSQCGKQIINTLSNF